jgi:hypothetical protein
MVYALKKEILTRSSDSALIASEITHFMLYIGVQSDVNDECDESKQGCEERYKRRHQGDRDVLRKGQNESNQSYTSS